MVTEADREAAAFDAESIKAHDLKPETPVVAIDSFRRALANLDRHRTASTAALTAEIQRLREWAMDKRAWAGMFALVQNPRRDLRTNPLYVGDPAWTLADAVIRHAQAALSTTGIIGGGEVDSDCACGIGDQSDIGHYHESWCPALSTPSEVTSPNPDEVAGTYSAFEVSEPVADETKGMSKCNRCGALWPSAPPGVIHKCQCSGGYCYPVAEHIGGEGENYPMQARVWKRQATNEWVLEIEGEINDTYMVSRHTQPLSVNAEDVPGLPTLYATPPNKNGDAVREALAKVRETVALSLAFIGRDQGTSRIDNTLTQLCVELTKADNLALATLAKHGGAEG